MFPAIWLSRQLKAFLYFLTWFKANCFNSKNYSFFFYNHFFSFSRVHPSVLPNSSRNSSGLNLLLLSTDLLKITATRCLSKHYKLLPGVWSASEAVVETLTVCLVFTSPSPHLPAAVWSPALHLCEGRRSLELFAHESTLCSQLVTDILVTPS